MSKNPHFDAMPSDPALRKRECQWGGDPAYKVIGYPEFFITLLMYDLTSA